MVPPTTEEKEEEEEEKIYNVYKLKHTINAI